MVYKHRIHVIYVYDENYDEGYEGYYHEDYENYDEGCERYEGYEGCDECGVEDLSLIHI